MDDTTKAALEKARAVLAETTDADHDHRDGPCPRCGGLPCDSESRTASDQHPRRSRRVALPSRAAPCAFGSDKGQYLPDFRLCELTCTWLPVPVTAYLEVKPSNWPNDEDREGVSGQHEQLMRSMALVWESEPDAVLLLARPPTAQLRYPEGDVSQIAMVDVLDLDLSPSGLNPYPWPSVAFWVECPDRRLGVGRLVHDRHAPWPDGYWKARR